MATAKKSAIKKPAKKPVIAKKAPVKAVTPAASEPPVSNAADTLPVGGRKPGRPAGSGKGVKRGPGRPKGAGKGSSGAGRKAATEFLYSIRDSKPAGDDGLGLDSPSENDLVAYVGPFPTEDAAMTAALEEIGSDATKEVVLFRDYRRGRVEVRRRLV